MMMMTEAPVELYECDGPLPPVSTPDGAALERVLDAPAGAWLGVVLEGIDPASLSDWELPSYLTALGRHQAWAASRVDDAVAELARRRRDEAATEVAFALREPLQVAQRRIWMSSRLRRLL